MRGIEVSADVCGGDPRISGTRIPVWLLQQIRELGVSETEILENYPTLTADDLEQVWIYADLHREEIREQIRATQEA